MFGIFLDVYRPQAAERVASCGRRDEPSGQKLARHRHGLTHANRRSAKSVEDMTGELTQA